MSARSCERVLSAHHKVLENVRLLRSVGARSNTLRAAISYVRVPTTFSHFSDRRKCNHRRNDTVAVSSVDNVPCHAKRVKGMVEG